MLHRLALTRKPQIEFYHPSREELAWLMNAKCSLWKKSLNL